LIDYVKIWYPLNGVNYALPKDSPLRMYNVYDLGTNECLNEAFGRYKGMRYKVRYSVNESDEKVASFLEISLSLHYLSNDFRHNYNHFGYSQLCKSIDIISSMFGIPSNKLILKNLEFGVNIKLPFLVNEILPYFLFYKRNRFKTVHDTKGNYIQSEPTRRFIKAYNKGLQFKLPYNLLRFENKYLLSSQFKKYGIETLADLKNVDSLYCLHQELLDSWDKCLIFEKAINPITDLKKKNRLLEWQSAMTWEDIMNQPNDRNKFARERKKLDKYIIEETQNKKGQIEALIILEWKEFKRHAINEFVC